MEKYGIIGAMESEVKELGQSLQNKEVLEYAGLSFMCGFLGGKNVVIVKSGIGKVNAALCAQALILKFNVTAIINTGIAGALRSGLGVFDFVISTAALYHDFDTRAFGYKMGQVPGMEAVFPADKALGQLALEDFEKTELENFLSDKVDILQKNGFGNVLGLFLNTRTGYKAVKPI